MRVLVVEDDEGIAQGLKANLRPRGWAVDATGRLDLAWAALRSEPFDLVLLDLGLADGDGTELLRRLRGCAEGQMPDPATPVLVMTARDQVASRIHALDLGADDYVTKPFDVDELAARMRALRRRAVGRARAHLEYGGVRIDPAARTVSREGVPVELSAREFDLLLVLLDASPRVLTRAQIEAKLYDWDSALDSNAIEVHVHRLRRKLGEDLIRTVRGVGYFVPAQSGGGP
jgi:DNA-binding response OmpR family regulator